MLETVAAIVTCEYNGDQGGQNRDLISGGNPGRFLHIGMGAGAKQQARGGQREAGETEDK